MRVVVADDRREALAIVLRLGDQVPGRPLRVPLSGLAADLSYAVRLEAPAAGPVPGLGRFEGAGLTVAPGYLPAQGLPRSSCPNPRVRWYSGSRQTLRPSFNGRKARPQTHRQRPCAQSLTSPGLGVGAGHHHPRRGSPR